MAKKKQKSQKSPKLFRILAILIVALFVVIKFSDHFNLFNQNFLKNLETSRSENKKIPGDIKRNLVQDYQPTYRIPILLYHYVEYVSDRNDATRESLNITPNIFEEQVKTLRNAGYTFMTAGELGEALDGKRTMPKKPVLLTFDDGHWDVATVILPILRKYHAKATTYIITGFLNGSDFLSDKQVKDLIRSGLVEIGSHTAHHVTLKDKILPLIEYELTQSKNYIEKTYRIKVVSFAYPDGAFDEQSIGAVEKAGYLTAVSTVPGITQSAQNKYFLFRIRPGRRTGADLLNYFNQTHFKPY
jgi:peptidoglycan/xylan/chitin deacetylase (PgdA/CDA1 family)